jgi:esterase FrsA
MTTTTTNTTSELSDTTTAAAPAQTASAGNASAVGPPSGTAPVVHPALAARARQWIAMGVDPDELQRVLGALGAAAVVPASPAWVSRLVDVGEAAMQHADHLAQTADADRDQVRRAYEQASFWFFLARFPAPFSPAAWDAYRRSLDAALRAGAFEATPLQVVSAPLDEADDGPAGEVIGHLRLPPTPAVTPTGRIPLVVLTGGIDVFKADIEIRSLADAFRTAGVATLAIDMPGTGESPLSARPGSEVVYERLLSRLAELPAAADIDLERVGIVGLSFGGHWATRLALTNQRIAAAVNISGPLHHAFAANAVAAVPPPTLAALAAAVHAPTSATDDIQPLLAELSVLDGTTGDLLTSAQHTPILAITGGRDELVPLADTTLLLEHGLRADTLIYATDRHVASDHWTEHVPFLTHWLTSRLAN